MKVLHGILVAAPVVFGFGLQAAADCLKVGEAATARGKLEQRSFKSAGGKPLQAFVLTPPAPACLIDEDMEKTDDVRAIELRPSDPALTQKLQRFLGKTVMVRGTASAGLTAWYYSPIVIEVEAIEPR